MAISEEKSQFPNFPGEHFNTDHTTENENLGNGLQENNRPTLQMM